MLREKRRRTHRLPRTTMFRLLQVLALLSLGLVSPRVVTTADASTITFTASATYCVWVPVSGLDDRQEGDFGIGTNVGARITSSIDGAVPMCTRVGIPSF